MSQHQPTIDLLARVTFEKRIIPEIKPYIKYNRTSAATYYIFNITSGLKKTPSF